MEITRKIFWNEAMKGGTVIGLAVILSGLLKSWLAGLSPALGVVMSIVNVALFVWLVFYYGKRISSMADSRTGFPFPRAVGFSVAMMFFVGFLVGVWNYIYNNFINPEGIKEAIDVIMVEFQDTFAADQFDMLYAMMNKWMFSPFYLIFASLLMYVIYGAIVGLITSSLTKKEPDIFSAGNSDRGAGPASGGSEPENRE